MSINTEERGSRHNNRMIQLGQELSQDTRYSIRMLRRNPGFTILVVVCLALGIGGTSAIFSLANTLLFRELPIDKPKEVVAINRGPGLGPPASYPDYKDYRDNNKSFSGITATSTTPINFSNGEQTEVILGEIVTGNYFKVLGVNAASGRTFLPEEDHHRGTNPVAVVSHHFWERRFNSDPNLVGKSVILNGQAFTVIGIAPKEFTGAMVMFNPDVWVPMAMQAQLMPTRPDWLDNRRGDWLSMLGRLKPGVSMEQAKADLNLIDGQLAQAYPDIIHGESSSRELTLSPATGIYIPHLRRLIGMVSTFLMALIGLVLLISCTNVMNMLLARATARHKEIAIRLALGAGRGRLIRQLLTESLVLALLGGIAGLALTMWLTRLMSAYRPPISPPYTFAPDLQLDWRVLTFGLVLSVATGMLFGLVPAVRASRPDLVLSLKDELSPSTRRFRRFSLRNIIVVAQVAISLVLLVSAALFMRSLQKMQGVDPGFKTGNAFLMSVDLDLQGYTKTKGRDFYRQLTERLKALPGVQSVSLVNYFPLGSDNFNELVLIEGQEAREGEQIYIPTYFVDPGFFQMMDIPLVKGRNFTGQEPENSSKVAIINERMADRFWPNEDAIGKRFRFTGPRGPLLEVIGIVRNSKIRSLGEAPRSVIYISNTQEYAAAMDILTRTSGDTAQTIAAARRQVRELDPNLPIKSVMTFDQVVDSSLWRERIGASLLTAFGFLGLILTTTGLYGVIAYFVARRTPEFGIRLALGASSKDIVTIVLKQGFGLIMIGLVIGSVLAFFVSRVLTNALYGVAADPLPFLGAPLIVIITGLLACYIPARRAAKLDPRIALSAI